MAGSCEAMREGVTDHRPVRMQVCPRRLLLCTHFASLPALAGVTSPNPTRHSLRLLALSPSQHIMDRSLPSDRTEKHVMDRQPRSRIRSQIEGEPAARLARRELLPNHGANLSPRPRAFNPPKTSTTYAHDSGGPTEPAQSGSQLAAHHPPPWRQRQQTSSF